MLHETSWEQLDAHSFVAPLDPMLLGSSIGLCVYCSGRLGAAAQPSGHDETILRRPMSLDHQKNDSMLERNWKSTNAKSILAFNFEQF